MIKINNDPLKSMIKLYWSGKPGERVNEYIGKFYNRIRIENKIKAKVEGNHGIYTTSIEVKGNDVKSGCSCYIGKHGSCHHTFALAITFLNESNSFINSTKTKKENIKSVKDIEKFIENTTLESLLNELKNAGITQKSFAEILGMKSQHLSSIKSSELRNRFYNELGVTKIACLYFIEKFTKKSKNKE